jgi:hypothetical protein
MLSPSRTGAGMSPTAMWETAALPPALLPQPASAAAPPSAASHPISR